MRKISFSAEQRSDLRRLSLEVAQVKRLEWTLTLIREDLGTLPSKADVRDPLDKLLAGLLDAEKVVKTLWSSHAPEMLEARSHLVSGAAAVNPVGVTTSVATASNGTIPQTIDVPTLMRLLVCSAELALSDEAPRTQRRGRLNATKAVRRIVEALYHPSFYRPDDLKSLRVAEKLWPSSSASSDFFRLCETVFSAATDDPKPPVESAIRSFLRQYPTKRDGSPWKSQLGISGTKKT